MYGHIWARKERTIRNGVRYGRRKTFNEAGHTWEYMGEEKEEYRESRGVKGQEI